MSGLLGLLDVGASAYAAQTSGVGIAGRNIANVNTEGYARESVDLRAELGAPEIGGVRSFGPRRAESELLSRRERTAAGMSGRADAAAGALLEAEDGLTPASGEIVGAIAQLFGGIQELAAAPLDEALRSGAIGDAREVAAAFRRGAATLDNARSDADARIKAHADEATLLAGQIAAANRAMATGNDPILADQRDLAAKKLATLTGGSARIDSDGKMRFVAAGGVTLVDGDRAASMRVTPDAAHGGHLRVDVVDGAHVDDITARFSGGRIGGELEARDGTLARAASELDQLAYDFTTQVDTVHAASAGLDGVSGRNLFVDHGSAAGAAAALAVDPAIDADPRLLAGAAAGAQSGDNTGFLALGRLADQPLAGAGNRSFTAEGIRLISAVGSDARQAVADRDLEAARADVLASARDSLSGVSTEEEAQRLVQFQRGAEAATHFLSTVDQLLGDLIERL